MRPLWFAAPLIVAVSMGFSAQSATTDITVTVDATKSGPVINRNILGQFIEDCWTKGETAAPELSPRLVT